MFFIAFLTFFQDKKSELEFFFVVLKIYWKNQLEIHEFNFFSKIYAFYSFKNFFFIKMLYQSYRPFDVLPREKNRIWKFLLVSEIQAENNLKIHEKYFFVNWLPFGPCYMYPSGNLIRLIYAIDLDRIKISRS